MTNDSHEVIAPEVRVIKDPKHPNDLKIQWAEGKGHSIKSWWLYIGTRSNKDGAYMLEIVNGPVGKATEVLVPKERFPVGVKAYIQVEGRINTHATGGRALEVGILSEETIWTRPKPKSSTAAPSKKTKEKELESPSIHPHL